MFSTPNTSIPGFLPGLGNLIGAFLLFIASAGVPSPATAQETRLLRQPDLSNNHVVFAYGSDIWIADRTGGGVRRITSTPAVESDPHFSPDGRQIAFTSNRSGTNQVYVVPIDGGTPLRLTWYPAGSSVSGWTNDGKHVLYASSRETAPRGFNRLWKVSAAGGPSKLLPIPRAHDAEYSPSGAKLIVNRVSRWDVEWRNYRGGQNKGLVILDLNSLEETGLPNERTTDIHPVWMDEVIYFLSDRNRVMNVWTYDIGSGEVSQITKFDDVDVKWLAGHDGTLILEQDGWLHTLDLASNQLSRIRISLGGDFPWAETRWENVSSRTESVSLSPTGKRALFSARGDVFTVPAKDGSSRNLTKSSAVADRAPIWSPDGASVAWFSDSAVGYHLRITGQDGMSDTRTISIGESKMAWDPAWSPDGKWIAFIDDDLRVRIVEVESGDIRTVDTGGANIERGSMDPVWSPDSKWLAYSKTFANNFHRIVVWSVDSDGVHAVTDMMADSVRPAWDRDGRHLYFVASTNLALGSGWANSSSMKAKPNYAAYVMVLRDDDATPFPLKSDEEKSVDESEGDSDKEDDSKEKTVSEGNEDVRIDFDGIERRIIALPMPTRNYVLVLAGPEGSVFIGARMQGQSELILHKFILETGKPRQFLDRVSQAAISNDGKKLLVQAGKTWKTMDTTCKPDDDCHEVAVKIDLRMNLDRKAEWRQMFEEAWRYERDFFYDPNMHGTDWNNVHARYAPLVEHIQHRADLNYVLDQINGELSVGHSFVRGGDFPAVDTSRVGLLGANLVKDRGGWKIDRILTSESWNPDLSAPLDEPGLNVKEGQYIVGVHGEELTSGMDPYRLLDGTAGRQTVLHINDKAGMDGAWTVTVRPKLSENSLRQRVWVEDNRRLVDELSDGRLAYVWIPNTSTAGVTSFDRYFFAQQDKEGAVVDERFNGGGSLDDYMVDLMTRTLRAAITNEVPDGEPFRLPAGILGPKVLLINELAGSGGDFFPWVFRHQNAGPLIGTRTWGGLVKNSVHYALVDGGTLTAPDNAVFDPATNQFIAENEGIPPDIYVEIDAKSASEGRDPQIERAVQELLQVLRGLDTKRIQAPPYPKPGGRN